jgi:hypothetical protein
VTSNFLPPGSTTPEQRENRMSLAPRLMEDPIDWIGKEKTTKQQSNRNKKKQKQKQKKNLWREFDSHDMT